MLKGATFEKRSSTGLNCSLKEDLILLDLVLSDPVIHTTPAVVVLKAIFFKDRNARC